MPKKLKDKDGHNRWTTMARRMDSPAKWHFRNSLPTDGLPLSSKIGRFDRQVAVAKTLLIPLDQGLGSSRTRGFPWSTLFL